MQNLAPLQAYLRDQRIDGWLVYDFRGNNPILAQLLPGKRWTTRRAILFIPARGEPVLLVHGIDEVQFRGVPITQVKYLSWMQLLEWYTKTLAGCGRVAMEYAPGGTLPAVSIVDAGTVELIRSMGVEVVSSANLIQVCVATWSAAAREGHALASRQVGEAKDAAFEMIRNRLADGTRVTEYEVQQHILAKFKEAGLETSEPPIVATNAHSGDPHFEVSAKDPAVIQRGDWVLIDLWARRPGEENIYSDITWVGYAGPKVPGKQREVFEVVRAARDRAFQRATAAWKKQETLQGWQLDQAARDVIIEAGYKDQIRHRTGHSLSPGPIVHGLGVNLDNLETHDTQRGAPWRRLHDRAGRVPARIRRAAGN